MGCITASWTFLIFLNILDSLILLKTSIFYVTCHLGFGPGPGNTPGELQPSMLLGRQLKTAARAPALLPENRPRAPKGNEKVFQPSIFRCYVCFREGIIFKRFRHLKARQLDELKKVERIGNAEQKS